MDQMKFDQILEAVNVETANRSKGSFKRALWYGNNNMWIGQNKGLRKGIQNAPKQLFMSSLGAIPLPPGISDIFSEAVNIALNKGKEIYGDEVKPWIKSKRSGTAIDAQRRNIKKDVKEMQAGAFQYIDRNLVKLKDAKNKIDPAVQALLRRRPGGARPFASAGWPAPSPWRLNRSCRPPIGSRAWSPPRGWSA